MKAVGIYKYLPINEPESFIEATLPKPKASGNKIVVQVQSVGVNPVDTKIRSPKAKVEENLRVLGWDVYGIVSEISPEAKKFKVGDRVFYSPNVLGVGANSEYHLVDERIVAKAPAKLSEDSIAGLPLVSLTAFESLFDRMNIKKGKSILIIGGAGGVGSIAIQLAKWAGLTVIATSSRSASEEWCKKLGADFIINHNQDFAPQIKTFGLQYVDYILCLNSTEKHWKQMAEVIVPEGHINSIVETSTDINLNAIKGKSVTFSWEFMSTRQIHNQNVERQGEIMEKIANLIDNGILKDITTQKLSPINAQNLKKAHSMLEAGDMIGKITVSGW
jgi:NADPH2:quinone reductase